MENLVNASTRFARRLAGQAVRIARAWTQGPPPAPQPGPGGFVGPGNLTRPLVSIIVLNLDKPTLTARCVAAVHEHSDGTPFELLVVDNGSSPENFALLVEQIAGRCTLIRLPVNRFFGEGNNIAVDQARGRFLVFLNNDAFVTAGWLGPLIGTIESDPVIGLVGPKLVFPDGRLQEVGARIGPDATVVRYGQQEAAVPADLTQPRDVDYCSAACILLPRALFLAVDGFSPAYEPAYYEDVDLCRRISARGLRIVCQPTSTVVHIENATSRTPDVFGRTPLHEITELNREKFLARWGDGDSVANLELRLPDGRNDGGTVRTVATAASQQLTDWRRRRRTVAFYTEGRLMPDGATRDLLAAALAATAHHRVVLVTRHPYSRLRLNTLINDLGLAPPDSPINMCTLEAVRTIGPVAVCVMTGDGVLPPIVGFGRRNIQICETIRPVDRTAISQRWSIATRPGAHFADTVIVASAFLRQQVIAEAAALGLPLPPVLVIPPRLTAASLQPVRPRTFPAVDATLNIVAVGRFFAGDHGKCHDVLIEAARLLQQRHPQRSFTLDIFGGLGTGADDRAHFMRLRARAEGLPVRFHPDASADLLRGYLKTAHLFWHAAGAGADAAMPHRMEPVGRAVLDAMAAGVVPLVCGTGGVAEIVTDGVDGVYFTTFVDLAERTSTLGRSDYARLSSAASVRACAFDGPAFVAAWRRLLAGLDTKSLWM
jgi:GT2 family glycosyltransferase/glycosyltransferase involved in cell wall biosynthesis